ncbi:MAG: type II secretion system F family protein [Candidatus Omnitrophota bacterium]|nr:MAG: type II secretion system F family protein [Candidatus Omnitrophota bacterium]
MPTYRYKARDEAGKMVKGIMDAGSKDELINKFNNMGYMVTQLKEVLPGVKMETVFDKLRMINTEDMILFYVQFSNMINAGISIMLSLSTLGKQIENKLLKRTITDISRSVEAGNSFSQALEKHPHVFPKLFVNIVRAGEASGKLDSVLSRFAEYAEYQAGLKQKIKGAFFYPVVLLAASVAVILFIVTTIMPQFAKIFMESGITLPLPTLILFRIGMAIRHFWYLVVFIIVIMWLALKYYIATERGRFAFDKFKLKLPVLGPLYRKTAISRFSRTLATLVASGVPILKSLDIVREVVMNEVLARTIDNLHISVEKGQSIAEPLKVSEEFPPDAVQMISAGEESGNLDGMLNKISDFYDAAVSYTIKKLTTIIEPVFLLIMGSVVGFIMASMLMPIFDMIRILRR